ncbi:MAG: hypothetical protein NDJ89_11240 [Oligoflexia bacterium]|nr:hypothetical protein [Oligoflexia bacterium]
MFAVQEAGTLSYDNAVRTLRFRPSRGGGLSAGQCQAVLAGLTREPPVLLHEACSQGGPAAQAIRISEKVGFMTLY